MHPVYHAKITVSKSEEANSLAGRLPSRMRGVATVTCSIYRG
jgi:hypothetical protein